MKKILIGSGLAAIMLLSAAGTVFASPYILNDQANDNACFGQGRAYFAQFGPNGVLSPLSNGSWISQRKGTNPDNNAGYIATYCTPTE